MNEEHLNDRTGSADSGRLHAQSGSRCVAFDQPPLCQDRRRFLLAGSWFSYTLCCCVRADSLDCEARGQGHFRLSPKAFRAAQLPSARG